jgi:quercetin dioxygenase-like cupin family protein
MSTIDFEPPRLAADPLQEPVVALLELLPAAAGMPTGLERRVRSRLSVRVARALQAGSQQVTLRRDRTPAETVAPGVTQRRLHAGRSTALRPGEPETALWVELEPGALWTMPGDGGDCREWLVMQGGVTVGEHELGRLGFLREGGPEPRLASRGGATVYLRRLPMPAMSATSVQHDNSTAWLPYGPGIERRLLWTDGRQAAMLYRTVAGAAVPRHGHRHDEECLVIDGELFLDDVLLRPGDYQLAPAGTEHREVCTDTGCLLLAHGDLDLEVIAR